MAVLERAAIALVMTVGSFVLVTVRSRISICHALSQEGYDLLDDAFQCRALRAEEQLGLPRTSPRDPDVRDRVGLKYPLEEAPVGWVVGVAEQGSAAKSDHTRRRESDGEIEVGHA